ncbi:MAG: S41 family peptidase [Cyclobacteriaceae bacterium]
MNKRFPVILFLLSTALFVYSQQKSLFPVDKTYDGTGQQTLEEIQQLILDNYYYDGITKDDLNWAAIEGMLRHISPPESPDLATLWTDEEYEKILNALKGVQVTMGFGSTFNSNDGSLTITSLVNDSEAEKVLKIQDRILRIDDQALSGKTLNEVNELLDGNIGQPSTLKIVRDISIFEVQLVRDSLKVENLIVSEIPNQNTALIELKKITVGLAVELQNELNRLRSENINQIILDLRNNIGGVLNEGINISRLFMKKNDIVLRTQSRSNGISNYAAAVDQFHDLDIVVLINENTASAAEIIASALKDHGRAILVGKKTYGKGVIETTFTLKNAYRVKFITSAMYSPKGNSWQSKGLLPDYFVDQTQAAYRQVTEMNITDRLRNDLHLSTALKLLNP